MKRKMSKKQSKQFTNNLITAFKEISARNNATIIDVACIMVKNLKPYIKSVTFSGQKHIDIPKPI